MASTDINGDPIVILTLGEAIHVLGKLRWHGGDGNLQLKLERFIKETEKKCSDDTNFDSSPAKVES